MKTKEFLKLFNKEIVPAENLPEDLALDALRALPVRTDNGAELRLTAAGGKLFGGVEIGACQCSNLAEAVDLMRDVIQLQRLMVDEDKKKGEQKMTRQEFTESLPAGFLVDENAVLSEEITDIRTMVETSPLGAIVRVMDGGAFPQRTVAGPALANGEHLGGYELGTLAEAGALAAQIAELGLVCREIEEAELKGTESGEDVYYTSRITADEPEVVELQANRRGDPARPSQTVMRFRMKPGSPPFTLDLDQMTQVYKGRKCSACIYHRFCGKLKKGVKNVF